MPQPYYMYGYWWVTTDEVSAHFPTDAEAWEYINDHFNDS